jgi:hypothetical protein
LMSTLAISSLAFACAIGSCKADRREPRTVATARRPRLRCSLTNPGPGPRDAPTIRRPARSCDDPWPGPALAPAPAITSLRSALFRLKYGAAIGVPHQGCVQPPPRKD